MYNSVFIATPDLEINKNGNDANLIKTKQKYMKRSNEVRVHFLLNNF